VSQIGVAAAARSPAHFVAKLWKLFYELERFAKISAFLDNRKLLK